MIPTGGVSLATAQDFLEPGALALGVGADLADIHAIREGRRKDINSQGCRIPSHRSGLPTGRGS
jgi:2-dehydro-3-deoxyphosphogluconate aldolase/(4S)-4-hydroxy-2-oxoglutarate aldolase